MAKNNVNFYLKYKFNLKARVAFYKKMKAFTESGFPYVDTLKRFKQRYDAKKDYRGKIIGYWLESARQGVQFSKAIEGWVPESELNLIASGEAGQGLAVGLGEAINFTESATKIKKAIVGGVTYPIVLSLVVCAFMAMFAIQIAPTYIDYLPIVQWPAIPATFYAISNGLVENWPFVLGFIALLAFIISKTINIWTGNTREIFDKLPPWSVYKLYQSSSFLITLAAMMKAGIPLNDSLSKIKKVSSRYTASYIDQMLKALKKGGSSFGKALDVGLMDEETAKDIIDYSELGSFETAIYDIGSQNLEDGVEKIESRMAVVKNIMLVIVGALVITIYYSTIELNTAVAEAASAAAQSMR